MMNQPEQAAQIPAATQLLAIAWLRWRMFANGFRRRTNTPRQAAGLIGTILLRLIFWPIFAMMAIGPAFGCGYFAWRAAAHHHPHDLATLLAAVFLGWQFIAVNGVSIAATLSNFDPSSLLRFPLRCGRYLLLRLMLGLLTPSTIIGCLALFAAAIGITLADSSLALPAFVALGIYALMNIVFSRMVEVWLERWLATRRAREIFGILMAFVVLAFQYFNFNRRALSHASSNSWLLDFIYGQHRFLGWLPPGYAAQFIFLAGHPLAHLPALIVQLASLLFFTVLFLAVLALRLKKQFLGEFISEGAPRTIKPAHRAEHRAADIGHRTAENTPATGYRLPATGFVSPVIAACLQKEWAYLRSNINQVVSMLTPLVFVFILGRRMAGHHGSYLLSAAIGYSMIGLLATLYNIFGADGAGMQLYFLAPVRLRDVVLAKNIASLTLLSLIAACAWCVALLISPEPIPLAAQVATFFWVVFMLFANLALGTLRSIQSPTKITVGQARRMRTPAANKTSGLLVLAMLFGSFVLQIPIVILADRYHIAWLGVFVFAPLAAAAIGAYAIVLGNTDRLMLSHRDTFASDLCGD